MSTTKIPTKLRYEILERDQRKCLWCGRTAVDGVQLHIDHVVPESFGGKTSFENLGTLCSHCNIGKSNEFCGQYLLTTLLKVKNFEKFIEFIETNSSIDSNGKQYIDAKVFRYSISFFKKPNPNYSYERVSILQEFPIGNMILGCSDDDSQIRIDMKKKENLFLFKDKLRDFLFENKGFFEELNGRLIFSERDDS